MRRILIIDDDPTNREILKWELAKDCAIDELSSGVGAAEIIAEGGHDLIVLDHMMPMKSGMEVVEDLQALAPGRLASVLLVTAAMTRELIAAAQSNGLAGAIERPYVPEEIRAIIERYCPLPDDAPPA